MNLNRPPDITNFYVAGINYKKTNELVRGSFAINQDQYQEIVYRAPYFHIHQLFVLSTCNRTEIYGVAEDPGQLIGLLCSQTVGDRQTFVELSYVKRGLEAIRHLFQVGAGLDSQILGDYEIVGQIKQAVRFSKQRGAIHSLLERVTNEVLKTTKVIKNQTALSDGTVSVSFAAIQYIRENVADIPNKKIILIGVGKIGRNTCKNLQDYLLTNQITMVNRTAEKAAALAGELGLNAADFNQLDSLIEQTDIILVATNAPEPILLKSHLENKGQKLIIDLSIPCNVEKGVAILEGVSLVTIDDLSKLKDKTLQTREAEVPKALDIIEEHVALFMEWHEMRKHVVYLQAAKSKLEEIHSQHPIIKALKTPPAGVRHQKIERVIKGMANKMRLLNQPGCTYLEAINEFMATGTS